MKKLLLHILLIGALLVGSFTSCNYNSDSYAAVPASPPSFRGLYVDSLTQMISDTGKQNTMIRWAVRKGFNSFYFYNLSTVLATGGNFAKLDSLVTRAKRAGITRFASARGSASTSTDTSNHTSTRYYNLTASANGKIKTFNLENEFWNYPNEGTSTFTAWLVDKRAMYTYSLANGYFTDAYIGHLKDPGGTTSSTTIADGLVQNNNRILVHDYVDTVRFATKDGAFNYMKSRLDAIGRAAISRKKIAHIVVIFAAYTGDGASYDMRHYYKTHTFQSSYDKVKASFDRATFAGKKGVILVGYQFYAYHRLKNIVQ